MGLKPRLLAAILLYSCILTNAVKVNTVSQDCFTENCTTSPLKFEDIAPVNYDKLVPPSRNNEPAVVQIRVSVLNINFVDEVKQAFGVDIFLHQIWTDPRLKIPASHNMSRLVLDSKWRSKLWTPDTYFKNLEDGKLNDIIIPYSYLTLDSNSELFFAARLSLKLDCEMTLEKYPHDEQNCAILVMSLQHSTDTVILKWKEFHISQKIILAQYRVGNEPCHLSSSRTYEIGEFSYLIGEIRLARRLGYFMINKYIPCTLIICMSFLTFWIPAEAYPARVTLSVTSLLTIVTQQYQSNMPSVSYVVALNIWMLSCIGFVFCSLLEYSVVIAVMNSRGKTPWPFCKLKDVLSSSKEASDQESGKHGEKPGLTHQSIDKMSRLLFPLLFTIFCISYFVYYLFLKVGTPLKTECH